MWRTSSSAADSTGNRLPEDSRMDRALVASVKAGDVQRCIELLEAGASPDAGHLSGYSVLGLAANRGHTAIAELLLQRRANPDRPIAGGLPGSSDVTPLMVAVVWSRTEIVELLLRQGCLLEPLGTAGSYRDMTALDIAREGQSPQKQHVARLLVSERARRRLYRLARLVPFVGRFALALTELYLHVHYRPGAAGALQARLNFEHVAAAAAPVVAAPVVAAYSVVDSEAEGESEELVVAVDDEEEDEGRLLLLPSPTLSILPSDALDAILSAVLDGSLHALEAVEAAAEEETGSNDDPPPGSSEACEILVTSGAAAVSRVGGCSQTLRTAVRAFASPATITRRCEALCARLEQFGLIRRRDAPPPTRLPTVPLPLTCGLEHLAVVETLGQWGGNQLSLVIGRPDPDEEEYVAAAAALARQHPTATIRIDAHAGFEIAPREVAEAQGRHVAADEAAYEAARVVAGLRRRGVAPDRIDARAWGSRIAPHFLGSLGVGSEVYVTLDGVELPPRPVCHEETARETGHPLPLPRSVRDDLAGHPPAGAGHPGRAATPSTGGGVAVVSTAASRARDRTRRAPPRRRSAPFESSLL